MNRKSSLTICCVFLSFLLVTLYVSTRSDTGSSEKPDSSQKSAGLAQSDADSTAIDSLFTEKNKVIVYYFHGNRRCITCNKLEAYSKEAIEHGFADKLKAGQLEWQVVNFEEEGNEHFLKKYQLYSQSLILSQINESKEVRWKNLDKIWQLVRTKDQFIKYVQDETRVFMNKRDK